MYLIPAIDETVPLQQLPDQEPHMKGCTVPCRAGNDLAGQKQSLGMGRPPSYQETVSSCRWGCLHLRLLPEAASVKFNVLIWMVRLGSESHHVLSAGMLLSTTTSTHLLPLPAPGETSSICEGLASALVHRGGSACWHRNQVHQGAECPSYCSRTRLGHWCSVFFVVLQEREGYLR